MAKKPKKKVKKTVKKPKKKAKVLKSKKAAKRARPKKIVRKGPKKIIRKKPKKIIKKAKPKKVIGKKIKKLVKKTRRKAAKGLIRRVPVRSAKPQLRRARRQHAKLAAGKKKFKAKTREKIRKIKRIKPKKKAVKRIKGPTKRKKSRKAKSAKPRVYIGKGALEQLFESQPKVKLLKFFFRNSKDIFQIKEIFKRLRSNVLILRSELNKLENIGVIKQKKAWLVFEGKRGKSKKEKKTVYYLNPAFDFVNELKILILKSTVASKDDLVNGVRKLGNIKLFVLTGLFAGDDTAKVDLLIVGDKINHRKLNNFIKDLEAEVGKELNCAIMSTKEFNYRYDMYDRFVRDILTGKSEVLINRVNLW